MDVDESKFIPFTEEEHARFLTALKEYGASSSVGVRMTLPPGEFVEFTHTFSSSFEMWQIEQWGAISKAVGRDVNDTCMHAFRYLALLQVFFFCRL